MKQKIKITREELEKAVGAEIFVKGAWASYRKDNRMHKEQVYRIHTEQVFRDFPDFIEIEVDVPEERLIVGYSDATTWDVYSKKVNDDFSNLAAVLQVKIRDEVADAIDSLEKRVEKLESAFNSKADQPVCINGNDYDINCMDEKCPVHFRYLGGNHE